MIRPIVLYDHPILRKEAKPVSRKEASLAPLIADMFDTMNGAEGLGLAAPQLGVPLQLFVVSVPLLQEQAKRELGTWPAALAEGVFINPRLDPLGKHTDTAEEGCLSIPGIRASLRRPARLRIRYEDSKRQAHVCELAGLFARVVQHEYDHLRGKLFIDYLSLLSRRMMKKKLSRLADLSLPYPILSATTPLRHDTRARD